MGYGCLSDLRLYTSYLTLTQYTDVLIVEAVAHSGACVAAVKQCGLVSYTL